MGLWDVHCSFWRSWKLSAARRMSIPTRNSRGSLCWWLWNVLCLWVDGIIRRKNRIYSVLCYSSSSVMATCGNVVRENGTYFVSPKHPDFYEGTGSCQLTINKINPNICQFRLDFDHFVLAGPETQNHVCNSDQFLVSGGSPVPTICGTNTGEHSKR